MIINIKLYKTVRMKIFTLIIGLMTALGAAAQNSGTTGPLNWSYDAGTKTLSITGTGAMPDYASGSDQPWYAFRNGIETVTIGSGVTTVGENAFRGCGQLQNITLPEGVTTIGEYAFLECYKLDGITIPSTVTAIGNAAFLRCYALPAIGVAAGSAHFTSADGVLYNKAKTELICYPIKKPGTDFTVPAGVKEIGGYAFSSCTLQSITLPEGLTTIGEYAFFNCSALKSVKIPGSVTSVKNYAFWSCTALTDVTVAWNTPLAIDPNVFKNVTLSGVTLRVPAGKGPAYQAANVWKNFGTITDSWVTVNPASLDFTAAGETKPLTVTASGAWTAASDQTWLTLSAASGTGDGSVNVTATANPGPSRTAKVTFTSGSITCEVNVIQAGTGAATNGTTGPLNWNYDAGTKTLTITGTGAMPDFNAPADRPWESFRSDIQTVTIGAGVTTIGEYAFHGCTKLPSITIPNSVTAIGEHAFGNCWTLTSITLPDGLQTIGKSAFSACAMTSITLPESLTTIEKKVFWGCDKLTSITIPNRVTTIGESAFYGCKKLPSITIPNGVTTIGKEAFYQCNTLTSVTIPKSMTTIGVGAFASCWALKSITLPNGVTTIENNTFYDCPSLTSITLPNRVTAIGRSAFAGCVALKSITLPAGLTEIGKAAFWNCWTLKSITFPNSVTTIGKQAFYGCTGLKDVTADWVDTASIPNLPTDAFQGVTQGNVKLHVPTGTTAAYQSESVWKDFQIIEAAPPTPTLSVTPKTLSFIDAGETKTITVNASAAWTAQCDASWITLSATSGTGNGTITVTAPAYEDEQPRTANIFFASGALKETVTVTQNPKPGPAFVALDYTELTLPAGASQRLVVTAYPKDADINRDVKWYSSNNDIATVSRDGTVTALAPGRADITVVANVGGQQTACRVRVVPAEQMVSVTSGGDNTLRLALVAPSDADFTLSFDVDLPEGFALDAKKTAPDASLAAGYAVTVTGKRVEMKPNGLRSGGTMEKRNLLTFACTAAPGTSKGSYKAALRNFTFTPTAGYALQNITVPFTFTHTVANQTIDGLRVYAADGALHLTLPTPETVHIYNVVGSLVRTMNASAGDHVLPLSAGMYVVRVGERVTKILIK